ncbi:MULTISPECIES: hypothetical protein [Halomonadaceae]|uniref:hypothetical protein n=1 Tax=Halomonadaceae TaxID=28256 RepID=UPI001598E9D1|nr:MULTISPECIES: hypothetical protein [Halomonas]QJQ94185.1 hypothetical protein HIO72_02020 [Halomonas sp. PA5]
MPSLAIDVIGAGAMDHQLEHFIDVAHGTSAPRVSALDAGRTLALVDAVARAADSGQCVTPTALGDAWHDHADMHF